MLPQERRFQQQGNCRTRIYLSLAALASTSTAALCFVEELALKEKEYVQLLANATYLMTELESLKTTVQQLEVEVKSLKVISDFLYRII